MLSDSIYTKYPEDENPQRQKGDLLRPGAGDGVGGME